MMHTTDCYNIQQMAIKHTTMILTCKTKVTVKYNAKGMLVG